MARRAASPAARPFCPGATARSMEPSCQSRVQERRTRGEGEVLILDRMDERAVARGIKALRIRRGWRQEDLARAAGLSRGALARIEQGHGSRVTVATLDRIAAALDARVICRLAWSGEGLDRLLDAAHAALVERIVRELFA